MRIANTPTSVRDAIESMNQFTDFYQELIEKMEEAYGLAQGLPAVVEGDQGIYEIEIMPVVPLVRREDGSTMRQSVYAQSEDQNAETTHNLFTNGTTTYKELVKVSLIASLTEFYDGNKTALGAAYRRLEKIKTLFPSANTNMVELAIEIISQRTLVLRGANLSLSEMTALVECLVEENESGVMDIIVNAMRSKTDLIACFKILIEE
ncbi:hypothetical protein P153DRAFT_391367 [Dothidotthia symphoricarpi CBS 119687]|uniref:Uncharacterized protein n=1 Tax=Dothidotthia symphoricarpi CBS 119687 TaxID=1392245 RepID=A0A6A5ZZ99_9PLEO|nr:uncharacterized protein P153DRAFT_391367 [Dothidotthia symphoricarpi CBS 119687]KAF2123641.1 hypothetical protein P153DRAFT_391367 [Dothidotthia symphoricarpi CBS 119687]